MVCVSQAADNEEKKREKRARMSKMESLMKELEGLLKQDGKKVFFSIDNSVLASFFIAIYMLKYCIYFTTILVILQDCLL